MTTGPAFAAATQMDGVITTQAQGLMRFKQIADTCFRPAAELEVAHVAVMADASIDPRQHHYVRLKIRPLVGNDLGDALVEGVVWILRRMAEDLTVDPVLKFPVSEFMGPGLGHHLKLLAMGLHVLTELLHPEAGHPRHPKKFRKAKPLMVVRPIRVTPIHHQNPFGVLGIANRLQ